MSKKLPLMSVTLCWPTELGSQCEPENRSTPTNARFFFWWASSVILLDGRLCYTPFGNCMLCSSSWDICISSYFRAIALFLPACCLFRKLRKTVSRPSFLLARSITSSVEMVLRPACLRELATVGCHIRFSSDSNRTLRSSRGPG